MRNGFVLIVVVSALLVSGERPAQAAPGPRMLVEAADYSGITASPDGRFVAFRVERGSVDDNRYTSRWFVAPTDGSSPPWEIGDGGEPLRLSGWPVNERAVWSQNGRWVYFKALHDGEVQVWRAPFKGGGAVQVTKDPSDIEFFSVIGDTLIYRVGAPRAEIAQAEKAEYLSGIRIDGSVPIGQNLYRSGYRNGRMMTERYAGEWMDRSPLLSDAPRIDRAVGENGKLRPATTEETSALETLASDARKFGAVARSSAGEVASIDAGFQVLIVRRDDGAATLCPSEACQNPSWFGWRPGERAIAFAVTDRAAGRVDELRLWDVAGGEVRTIVRTEGSLNGGTFSSRNDSCALTARFAICAYEAADTPPELRRVDLNSGETVVVHTANSALAAAHDIRVELLKWEDASGRAFTGRYFPAARADRKRVPLFVNYYSCPGYVMGGGGEEWPLAAMAEAGIAALCINMSPNEDRSEEAGRALIDYEIALSGISSALDLLAEHGIDRKRVGIGGYSFGAEVAMWAAMNSDMAAAVSVGSPVLSETYYWQRALMGDDFHARLMRGWGLGAPDETPEQWRRVSPTHNLDRIDAPMLIQAPEEEYLVAIDYFVPMVRAGMPAEMYVFPDEPHWKFQPRHRLSVLERNLAWFRFWLQGYEGPDTGEEQYARWRKLRDEQCVQFGGEDDAPWYCRQ